MSGSAAHKPPPANKRYCRKRPRFRVWKRDLCAFGADQLLLEEDGFTILLAGILFMAEVLRSFSNVLP